MQDMIIPSTVGAGAALLLGVTLRKWPWSPVSKVIATHNGHFEFHISQPTPDLADSIYVGSADTVLLTIERTDEADELLEVLVNGTVNFTFPAGQGESSRTVKLWNVDTIGVRSTIDPHTASGVKGTYTISVQL